MRRVQVAARLLAFAALTGLAACGVYGSVGLERREIAGYYSVDPQIEWSRYSDGGMEVWTVDGMFLDSLQFTAALENGDKLYDISGKEDVPLFRSNMTESEVMEFVADSFAAAGAQKIETRNLAPAPFGPLAGFRFDMTFQSENGLDKLGTVLGTLKDGELYLIIYSAAAQHYYPLHKPAVEKLLASIQI
jgi:hypothetical protein